MTTFEILNSHTVSTLRQEIRKHNIRGYSKKGVKKADIIKLMIHHKDKFGHIVKKEKTKAKAKTQTITKAKPPTITKPTIKNKFYYKKKNTEPKKTNNPPPLSVFPPRRRPNIHNDTPLIVNNAIKKFMKNKPPKSK